MVIEKILKVESNDPKAGDLRARLAALKEQIEREQQQANPALVNSGSNQQSQAQNQNAQARQVSQGTQSSPSNTVQNNIQNPQQYQQQNQQSPSSSATSTNAKSVSKFDDEIKGISELPFEQQKRFVERREPQVRLQEERTLALVMTQIQEMTTLFSESSKKQREFEAKQAQLEKGLEQIKDKHEELIQKMNSIDSRLEKFMGLYELITNQYNPFASQSGIGGTGINFGHQTPPPQQRAPIPASNLATSSTQQISTQTPSKPAQEHPKQQDHLQASQFAVEDTLTNQSSVVTVDAQDAQAAQAHFKKVEELLADLQLKHNELQKNNSQTTTQQSHAPLQQNSSNSAQSVQIPSALTGELHRLLGAFEERLGSKFDAALKEQLHSKFNELESRIQSEVRDALRDEIAAVQHDDEEVQKALSELQSLVQARERNQTHEQASDAEEALALMQRQLRSVRDDIKSIPPNLYFRQLDGKILRDIKDLRNSLELMKPEVFSHHVNNQRNDFALWVREALAMPTLASLLEQSKTPSDMRERIILHDGLDD